MRAIVQTRFGGPEVLEATELPAPRPGPDEVLIDVALCGINFADLHARENRYLDERSLPFVPGAEVVGTRRDDGRRVVAHCATGGYAEVAAAPARHAFAIPQDVDDAIALALFVQGATAWHLVRTAAALSVGETVLVISGAGGTGRLLVQLARRLGAGRVIATASSAEKRAALLELGADAALDGEPGALAEGVREVNDGAGVDVVFEPSGGAVFDAAFDLLEPFGRIVVYGIASSEPNEVRTSRLLRRSRTVAGFRLSHALERPAMIEAALEDLFALHRDGRLDVLLGGVYPLADAARAHTDLQARRTTGKLMLDPRA